MREIKMFLARFKSTCESGKRKKIFFFSLEGGKRRKQKWGKKPGCTIQNKGRKKINCLKLKMFSDRTDFFPESKARANMVEKRKLFFCLGHKICVT